MLGTKILGLSIGDRAPMITVLGDQSTAGLAEFRTVLLLEHEGRVRQGLVEPSR